MNLREAVLAMLDGKKVQSNWQEGANEYLEFRSEIGFVVVYESGEHEPATSLLDYLDEYKFYGDSESGSYEPAFEVNGEQFYRRTK